MDIARILGLAALLAAGPLAAEGRLDAAFGDSGWVIEGFQPDAAGGPVADADIGFVACAGASGRLVASGMASGLTRVVTMFLTPGGELDTSIGFGGKQSFPLPAGAKTDVRGLCQPDGKPVIVYNLARSTDTARPHHEMHLLRIDPATGLPDAGFGSGGSLRIDLDLEFGATVTQRPLAVVAEPDGGLIVMGSYEIERRQPGTKGASRHEHGFVLRVTPAGVLAAATSAVEVGSSARRYIGGGVASGHLRAAGSEAETARTPGRVMETEFTWPELHRFGDTVDAASQLVVPYSARIVDNYLLAVAASLDGAPAVLAWGSDKPQRVHCLPVPTIDGAPAAIFNAQVAAGAQGLYFAGSVARGNTPEALYAAKLIGTPNGAQPDPRFGHGGMTLVRGAPVAAGCASPRTLGFARFTFWAGALTLIGAVDRGCLASDPDYDYAVLRLESRLFGDGLEERHPVR